MSSINIKIIMILFMGLMCSHAFAHSFKLTNKTSSTLSFYSGETDRAEYFSRPNPITFTLSSGETREITFTTTSARAAKDQFTHWLRYQVKKINSDNNIEHIGWAEIDLYTALDKKKWYWEFKSTRTWDTQDHPIANIMFSGINISP